MYFRNARLLLFERNSSLPFDLQDISIFACNSFPLSSPLLDWYLYQTTMPVPIPFPLLVRLLSKQQLPPRLLPVLVLPFASFFGSINKKSIFSTNNIVPNRRPKLDVTKYDRHNLTLQRFEAIKNGSPYLHVTGDKLWGGKTFFADQNNIIASIEEQAAANIDALVKFTKQYNRKQNLDGFCIEINDETARSKTATSEEITNLILRMLKTLAENDPSKVTATRPGDNKYYTSISKKGKQHGWRFRFHGRDYFVTVHAPCYSQESAHFAYDANRAFILLQPEKSAVHDDDGTSSSSDMTEETQSWVMVDDSEIFQAG